MLTGITILAIIVVALLLTYYSISFYPHTDTSGKTRVVSYQRWSDRWSFGPENLGGFSYYLLVIVSFAGLFVELLMIRWISCEIRIFAYFKNFVLIGCFLGFGLGCYLCRRPVHLFPIILPIVFFVLLITLPIPSLRYVVDWSLSTYIGTFSEVHVWGVPALEANYGSIVRLFLGLGVIIPLFILIVLMFVPIGQLLGWLLENAPNGVVGYTVNILGSLGGILFYTFLCSLGQPPTIWFTVAGLLFVMLFWKVPALRWTALLSFAFCTVLLIPTKRRDTKIYWSPYHKLAISPLHEDGKRTSYRLTTNNVWSQTIVDLSDAAVNHPHFRSYNLPFRFHPTAKSVLVLGSGTGNDVASALRNGADEIVAVEIDPTIVAIGEQFHPEKPYQNKKVRTIVNDARNYVERTTTRFDLIILAFLDSHPNSPYYTNIRTDNYVYTMEALEANKHLLKPEGIMVVKFAVGQPWIRGRLEGLLTRTFGRQPFNVDGYLFVVGSATKITQALSEPKLGAYVREHSGFVSEPCTLTSDDWPYFYQKEPGLPASVIILSVMLIAVCLFAFRRTRTTVGSIHWHFFFLGAGFLLLEVHIVSKMALLFGTTWMVNSIVISGLLLMIVAANLLVMLVPKVPRSLAYAGLLISISFSYLLPPACLFIDPLWLKIVVASAVLCLPVFFAGVIFVKSFAQSRFSGEALGSNLIGALVGGLLEALSFWFGIKALLLIGALLYVGSLVTLRFERLASIQTSS